MICLPNAWSINLFWLFLIENWVWFFLNFFCFRFWFWWWGRLIFAFNSTLVTIKAKLIYVAKGASLITRKADYRVILIKSLIELLIILSEASHLETDVLFSCKTNIINAQVPIREIDAGYPATIWDEPVHACRLCAIKTQS